MKRARPAAHCPLALLCERRPGAVFLIAFPLGLIEAVVTWQWQIWATTDGFNLLAQFVFYGLIFVYGYPLYADERLRRAVQRDSLLALALGMLAFVPRQLPGVGDPALAHDYSAGGMLAAFPRACAAWLGALGSVGLGMRYLIFTNKFLHGGASYQLEWRRATCIGWGAESACHKPAISGMPISTNPIPV